MSKSLSINFTRPEKVYSGRLTLPMFSTNPSENVDSAEYRNRWFSACKKISQKNSNSSQMITKITPKNWKRIIQKVRKKTEGWKSYTRSYKKKKPAVDVNKNRLTKRQETKRSERQEALKLIREKGFGLSS